MCSSPICNDAIRGCDKGYLWCTSNECDGVCNGNTDQVPYGRILSVWCVSLLSCVGAERWCLPCVIASVANQESMALYVVVMTSLWLSYTSLRRFIPGSQVFHSWKWCPCLCRILLDMRQTLPFITSKWTNTMSYWLQLVVQHVHW